MENKIAKTRLRIEKQEQAMRDAALVRARRYDFSLVKVKFDNEDEGVQYVKVHHSMVASIGDRVKVSKKKLGVEYSIHNVANSPQEPVGRVLDVVAQEGPALAQDLALMEEFQESLGLDWVIWVDNERRLQKFEQGGFSEVLKEDRELVNQISFHNHTQEQ